MAHIDAHNSLGTGKITISRFKKIWRDRLVRYKEYITDEIIGTDAKARYLEYSACKNPEEVFGMPEGLTEGEFIRDYLSSTLCLDRHMEWATDLSGGMGVTGTPGVAKTSVIMKTCEELGIACVHFTVAGLMGADIKGLPYLVKNENNVTTGVEYEQGTRLPISPLSANLSGMSDEVFFAKMKLGMPSEMRYLKPGVFSYCEGIAPEFGVLLIDEFTNLDQHAQATMEKIISKSEKGYRGLAEGSYVLPPYWIVICAMNSSTEGGMSRGDEEDDISEFIRQRLAMHGFYTVYADSSSIDYLEEIADGTTRILPEYLRYAHRMNKKGNAGIDSIEGEDLGYLQYPGPAGRITSPRLFEGVMKQASELAKNNAANAYDAAMSEDERAALAKEREDVLGLVAAPDFNRLHRRSRIVSTGVDPSEFDARLDRAKSVVAKRSAELKKAGKELTCAEYQSILRSLIGIDEIVDDFAIYYNVHKGVYAKFSLIEGPLRDYLLGKVKVGPKLESLGEDVAKNAVAIGMSMKGYLLAMCRDVVTELFNQLKDIVAGSTMTEDKLYELADTAVTLYQVPLRVGRWLNSPKLFPVGIKDEVAAICKDVFNLTVPLEGVNVNGHGTTGSYLPFSVQAVSVACRPVNQELKALAPNTNKSASGAFNALFGQGRNLLAFVKADKSTDWMPKRLKEPIVLPSGMQWAFEVADEADIDYMDIVTSEGSIGGNSVSELFAESR